MDWISQAPVWNMEALPVVKVETLCFLSATVLGGQTPYFKRKSTRNCRACWASGRSRRHCFWDLSNTSPPAAQIHG